MTSATTLNNDAPVRAPRLLGLYLLLIIIAAIESFDGLSNASILFGDMSQIPGPRVGGAIIKAYIASHPVLALAALGFATIGRLRYAIIALAARNQRLGLAAMLVSIPTLYSVAAVIAFGIGIFLYGF
ncbi:hypothetical protein V1283_001099 [Bradyrhizobium sp. AZCC 2262]|uniref:hypothetical protein n=1 Tax=Bradyrhizobium sp. AZCC 2262 TaxID=3117022 RepID=UPI002FF3A0B3